MGVLSVRNVPEELMWQLRHEAAELRVTVRELCIRKLGIPTSVLRRVADELRPNGDDGAGGGAGKKNRDCAAAGEGGGPPCLPAVGSAALVESGAGGRDIDPLSSIPLFTAPEWYAPDNVAARARNQALAAGLSHKPNVPEPVCRWCGRPVAHGSGLDYWHVGDPSRICLNADGDVVYVEPAPLQTDAEWIAQKSTPEWNRKHPLCAHRIFMEDCTFGCNPPAPASNPMIDQVREDANHRGSDWHKMVDGTGTDAGFIPNTPGNRTATSVEQNRQQAAAGIERLSRGYHVLQAKDGSQDLCGGPGVCKACDDHLPQSISLEVGDKVPGGTITAIETFDDGTPPRYTVTPDAPPDSSGIPQWFKGDVMYGAEIVPAATRLDTKILPTEQVVFPAEFAAAVDASNRGEVYNFSVIPENAPKLGERTDPLPTGAAIDPATDTMRKEYDFSQGVRGKYAGKISSPKDVTKVVAKVKAKKLKSANRPKHAANCSCMICKPAKKGK